MQDETQTRPTTGCETDYTVWSAMLDIVAAPGRALDAARENTKWFWLPMFLSIGVTVAVTVYYSFWVDSEWLIQEMARSLPADQASGADQMRELMSPSLRAIFGTIGIIVVTLVIFGLQAAYLNLVNKVGAGPSLGYGHWFGFSAWTAFVGIFQSLIMLGIIITAETNQLPQHELTPLSINSLFIHAEAGESWFTWGESIGLFNIWMLVLMAIGYNRWTGASPSVSAVVVVAPWAVLFGGWALIIGL